MEMEILLYAIALPSFVGVMFSYCGNLARKISVLTGFNGCALAATLLLSSMSQESLIQFTSQNRWLWFPLTTFMIAVLTDACGLFKKIMPLRIYIAFAVIILGAAFLLIPSWDNLSRRLFLGVAVGGCATVLVLVVEKRKCFSTSLGLSFSLIAPSVLAMLSGFAKLAIPLGAVAFCLGIISLIELVRQMRGRKCLGLGEGGGVVVASIAGLGSATGFGYDTTNIPIWIWVLSAAAPLGLCLGEFPGICLKKIPSACARICGCVILAVAAILMCVLFQNSSASSLYK